MLVDTDAAVYRAPRVWRAHGGRLTAGQAGAQANTDCDADAYSLLEETGYDLKENAECWPSAW